MPHTGEKCPTSGTWRGDDEHKTEIHISAGETFPPCSHCHHSIHWTLVRAA
jgi:hypothetical protein